MEGGVIVFHGHEVRVHGDSRGKLLDGSSGSLRAGKYPENSAQIAKVLRAVAEEFDA